MRFRLRTLLIVLAILPPLLWIGWTKYAAWKVEQERRAAEAEQAVFSFSLGIAR
jgi:predicted negative regulator of RcsB-dependent stress response